MLLSNCQRGREMDSRRVPVADMLILGVHNDVGVHVAGVPKHQL